MANPYLGEIRMFAGTFAPVGWALCNGQLLAIAASTDTEALFNLIGTTYGGDGQSTFALPDLRGRVPIHQGQGPGLANSYVLAEMGGAESVTLTVAQLPSHTHTARGRAGIGTSDVPANRVWAAPSEPSALLYGAPPNVAMASAVIQNAGGRQAHENMLPFLAINFIICLSGIFPSPT